MFDGGAPSDLAVLLLDLWRAAFGDEGAEFAAESTTHKAECVQLCFWTNPPSLNWVMTKTGLNLAPRVSQRPAVVKEEPTTHNQLPMRTSAQEAASGLCP